MQNSLNLE